MKATKKKASVTRDFPTALLLELLLPPIPPSLLLPLQLSPLTPASHHHYHHHYHTVPETNTGSVKTTRLKSRIEKKKKK